CTWPPYGLELRFGFDGEQEEQAPAALPAFELTPDVRLRGIIDRVDVDPADGRRAIVRDHKSGSARPERQGARWATDRRPPGALEPCPVTCSRDGCKYPGICRA